MTRLLLVLSVGFLLASSLVFGDETSSEVSRQFGTTREQSDRAIQIARNVRKDIERDGLFALAYHSDRDLDALVERATQKLEEHGDAEYAYWKRTEWKREYSGFLTRMMLSRHQGDHPTEFLSQWIEDFYDHTELILGVDICKMFHLSDIKTINTSVKVCLKPCDFAMDSVTIPRKDEYRNHFAKDIGGVGELYGLTPVLVYWAVEIGLMAGGVTSPLAMVIAPAAEWVMGAWVSPKLSDWIWDRACVQ